MPVLGGAPIVHAHDADEIGGLDAEVTALATAADQALTARQVFGERQGVAIGPATISPAFLPELWTLANLDGRGQQSTLSPSLTANSTTQNRKTTISLGNMANADTTYRIEFDVTNTVTAGDASVSLYLMDSSGALISGTAAQRVSGRGSPSGTKQGRFTFDFRPPSAGGTYLTLALDLNSAATSGTLGVSNVSLKTTGDVSRPMLISQEYATGTEPYCYWQGFDQKSKTWKMAQVSWAADGALTPYAYHVVNGYTTDRIFGSGQSHPDPAFTAPDPNTTASAPGSAFVQSVTPYALRSNNNDQIIEVLNGSGTFELSGNTHGGEYPRGAATFRIDTGAGWQNWTVERGLRPVRRFQVDLPTEYRRSTDGTTPFANVDHLFTVYADGVIRCDRTTTFLSTQTLRAYFEWMSSFPTNVGYLGRMGRGTLVHGEIDTRAKVATPTAPTVTTSGTGGTLAAATYSYRVAALSSYGETVPSAAGAVVTTGTTSATTVTWSSVTGATGYAVYGRTASPTGGEVTERLLARTTALSWTDDGSLPPTAPTQRKNTAATYGNGISTEAIHTTDASWACFYDPRSGWAYGNIYDRESPLERSQVAQVRSRLEGATGNIQKNYANLVWTTGATTTVPPATAWTATHWSFVYLPRSEADFHAEISARASSLSALKTLYVT